jgi:hypothetical protein
MWVIGNQGGKKSLPPAVSSISSQAPSSPIPEATSGSSWNEEKPPPGVGRVLNYAQLRYCVAEDIRVKAMEGMINRYRGVEVGGFNSYVSDFNGRCGSFKYRSGSLESVRSDAANRTAQIEEEARQRVLSWRSQSGALQPRLAPATAVLSVPEARSPGARRSVRQTEETGASAREESKPVSLSADEGTSLEAACSNDRYLNGPVAYKACLARQIEALERAPRGLKLTGLSADERQSTEAACSNDKYLNGPAAYNRCIARQLASLSTAPRDIDLSSLSRVERESLDAACSNDKYLNGPAALNACIARQLSSLSTAPRDIDLSWLSRVERESLDAACSNDKYLNGPAALNACIGRQVAALRTAPRNIDMSALNGASRSAVEMACSNAKYLNGPAAYNRCLSQQVTAAQR